MTGPTPEASEQGASHAEDLVTVALRGLSASRPGPTVPELPFTLRGVAGLHGPQVRPEGHSLRYTAIASLGLGRQPRHIQRSVLRGRDAAALAQSCVDLSAVQPNSDPGALALSLWAAGEVAGTTDEAVAGRLLTAVRHAATGQSAIATVTCAWAVDAGLAMPAGETASALAREGAALLLADQGPRGTFPPSLPRAGGLRGHVGSFADQVYPIQALARFAARTGESSALAAAEATADRIVQLQGPAGQWWWHYDARTGDVVERYPVYSVHQHGMAPMVLAELARAGGTDHRDASRRGYSWLWTHPECLEPLVAPSLGVVWRKVGRREPRKAARALAALVTRVRPGAELPGVDRVFPPGPVDHECRPYELGWLLYASFDDTDAGGTNCE